MGKEHFEKKKKLVLLDSSFIFLKINIFPWKIFNFGLLDMDKQKKMLKEYYVANKGGL